MSGRKRKSLAMSILQLMVIPIMILGIVLTIYSINSVRDGMSYEIEKSLSGTAHSVISMYNIMDGGEFSYRDGHLYKGETDLTADYRLLDDLKNDTGAEVTVSYGKYRRLTTLVDEEGNRALGTELSADVVEYVLNRGEEYFSEHVRIEGEDYFAYYVPIRNDENEVVGVSFAGKSARSVDFSMRRAIEGNIIIGVFVILLTGIICNFFARRIVETIQHIKDFLGLLAKGNFQHKMPEEVLNRRDEFAEIGEYAVAVSQSLNEMVTRDPLTRLLNRRACLQRVQEWESKKYTLVMGDIDFFKNVNDTYGHEMGDTVLKFVSNMLTEQTGENGFVSRWGGEEFLLCFDCAETEVCEGLEKTRQRIEDKKFETDGHAFHITITFGLTEHGENEDFDETLKRADDLLYQGKKKGRNRIMRK